MIRWLVLLAALLMPVVAFPDGGAVPPAPARWRVPALFLRDGAALRLHLPDLNAWFDARGAHWRRGAAQVAVAWVGMRSSQPEGLDPEGRVNRLLGATPAQWQRDQPAYRGVRYPSLRPGIHLDYRVAEGRLKSEWRVGAGVDPARIRWRYEGARSVSVDERGGLRIVTEAGEFREAPPFAYQPIVAANLPVEAAYVVEPDGTVGFRLGALDREAPLVIDPAISFSTALGGTGNDVALGVAVDASANVYVAGYTDSTDFPATAGLQAAEAGSVDAFVAKFTSTGTLVYATYLGGSGDDRAYALAVDSTGDAIVVGYTTSTNFPTASSMQASYRGARDAFVAKLNSSGNGLVFSTYVGGSGLECAYGVALDGSGNIYVAGETRSTDFPTLTPYQASLGGRSDVFVVKLSSAGAQQYGTYIGGTGDDRAYAIAVDTAGSVYLTGGTDSPNYPVLSSFQAANGGGQDAFVTKLNASGSALVYSTYLGGNGGSTTAPECGFGIAVDSSGYAYVTGVTSSTNFPVKSAYQSAIGVSQYNAFVTKLAVAGNALVYSTYLGGSNQDTGRAIAVDSLGAAYVAGSTSSYDFPVSNASQSSLAGTMNGFVAELSVSGASLGFATYLGGNSLDSANAIGVDATGAVVVAGQTQSSNFPAVNAYQPFYGGDMSAFLTRFAGAGGAQPSGATVTPSSGTGTSRTFTFTFTDTLGVQDFAWVEMLLDNDTNPAGGCLVHFDRASQALYLGLESGSAARGPQKLGVAGSMENRQCAVDLGASSVSLSGTSLTLNLAVRFKPVFQSTVTVYMQSQSNAGLTTSWQPKGTWN